MTKLLVTGGRDYNNKAKVFEVLDLLHEKYGVTTVIHGAAKGADSLASLWCKERLVTEIACPADWKLHGRAAGPIRNQQMLTEHQPDLVIAFPGGRGTANMCKIAHAAGVEVLTFQCAADTRSEINSTLF